MEKGRTAGGYVLHSGEKKTIPQRERAWWPAREPAQSERKKTYPFQGEDIRGEHRGGARAKRRRTISQGAMADGVKGDGSSLAQGGSISVRERGGDRKFLRGGKVIMGKNGREDQGKRGTEGGDGLQNQKEEGPFPRDALRDYSKRSPHRVKGRESGP